MAPPATSAAEDDLPPLDRTGEAARDAMVSDFLAGLDPKETARRLIAELEAEVARLESAAPPPKPLACKAGCAWCCHQGVDVTLPEASLIAAWLDKSVPPAERRRLVAAVRDVAARSRGLTPVERQRAAIPCAFLKADGACGIYAVRPLLCRAALATDAERCRRAFVGGEPGTEETWREPAAHAKQLVLGTAAGYRLATGSRGVYELHALLAAVFDKVDGAAGA